MTLKVNRMSQEDFMKKHGFAVSGLSDKRKTADEFKKDHGFSTEIEDKKKIPANEAEKPQEIQNEVNVIKEDANEVNDKVDAAQNELAFIGDALFRLTGEVEQLKETTELLWPDYNVNTNTDFPTTISAQAPDGWVADTSRYFDDTEGWYRRTLENRFDTDGYHVGTLQLYNVRNVARIGNNDTKIGRNRAIAYFKTDSDFPRGTLDWVSCDQDFPKIGKEEYRSLNLDGGATGAIFEVQNFQTGRTNTGIDTQSDMIGLRAKNRIDFGDTGVTEIFWHPVGEVVKDVKVAVTKGVEADYLGDSYNNGCLRVDTIGINYNYTGGNTFLQLQHWDKCNAVSNTDSNTLLHSIEIDQLGHIATMEWRTANGLLPPGDTRYRILAWNDDGVNNTWQVAWLKAHA